MWTDVVDLRDFYASPLGLMARRLIRRRIRETWGDLRGQRVMGFGFATPYLRPFLGEAERAIALMPAPQGVIHWPPEGRYLTALTEEGELPLADRSIDRILVVHAFEASDQLQLLLRELWRVLADGGRLLVVVANRRGIWARLERTPFGHGRPFTGRQMSRMLRDAMFTPLAETGALYLPPSRSRLLLAMAAPLERVGHRWFGNFGGALLMEASKQLYAAAPAILPREARALRPVPGLRPAVAGRLRVVGDSTD